MANAPQTTSAGTKEAPGAENAAPLSPAEQAEVRAADTADTTPRAKPADESGKRVRAIFYGGGTTKEVRKQDFGRHGIEHPTVVFDYRKDNATLPVGPKAGQVGLSEEAAEFLTREFPLEFEYLDN